MKKNSKRLKIALLKEQLEKITKKTVVLEEGTWSLPKTADQYLGASSCIEKLEIIKKELYNLLGDDELFDGIDSAIRRGNELLEIAKAKIPSLLKEETTREDILAIQRKHLDEWKQLLKPEVYEALEKWATEKNDEKTNIYDIVRGSMMDNFIKNYLNGYTPLNENAVSANLPSSIDSFLQDIAQMTELLSYQDIMNFKPSDEDIKKLAFLIKKIKSFIKTNDIEDEEISELPEIKEIVNIIKGKIIEEKKKFNKSNTSFGTDDYIKAVKKADRELEKDINPGFKRGQTAHKSEKDYNRKEKHKKNVRDYQ